MATATKEKVEIRVPPFGIEINSDMNNDVKIKSLAGLRLRGAIKPRPFARTLPTLPEIPGMQIHVNPAAGTYVISDPLCDDPELCERIRITMVSSDMCVYEPGSKVLTGVASQKGELGIDEMKTLCREMLHLLNSDPSYAVMSKGPKPSMEDVDELPGDYLYSPNPMTESWQPRYEKDVEAWRRRLGGGGG